MHKHNVIFNRTVTKLVTILTKCFFSGSRTIAPEENYPLTLKLTLTLTQTLTLTGGQFSSGAIVRIPFLHI